MADFTTANLAGANKFFNAAQNLFSTIKDTLKAKIFDLASTFISSLLSNLLDFGDKLKSMIPELPDLPPVNLQSELTSLQSLTGSSRDIALASLKSKFGSGLSAQGVELNDLVSKATDPFGAGKQISAEIPNFTIPVAGGDVVEKAKEVLQADDDDIEEILSDEVNQEIVEELKKTALESQEIQQKALVEKIKEAALEPIGYVKKNTNTFET